jgi:hypothetical protein
MTHLATLAACLLERREADQCPKKLTDAPSLG